MVSGASPRFSTQVNRSDRNVNNQRRHGVSYCINLYCALQEEVIDGTLLMKYRTSCAIVAKEVVRTYCYVPREAE